jgi:hypothetical protein
MTNLEDFDRSLAAFLADGPNTAPEAPVIAALAHARTTPRRPDVLAAFRSDVMAPRRALAFGLRPGLVLAVLGLLIAAMGVAVVGSRLQERSVVPGPSSSPGPSAATEPSAQASRSATPAAFSSSIPLKLVNGGPLTIRVTDTTGALVDASSLLPREGASVDWSTVQIEADPTDAAALIVTWTGMSCETPGELHVDEAASRISLFREPCEGDTVAFDRIVRLVFNAPVDAASWTGVVVAEPISSDGPAPAGS